MDVPVLTTENLVLRPIDERDIAALFNLFSNDTVTRFMDIESFINVTEASQLIAFLKEKQENGEGVRWAITFEGHNDLIGTCGFHHFKRTHYKAEIGYDLLPAFWGKGIMIHAVHRLLQYGYEQLQLNRIEAFVDPANTSSFKLLERLGFKQEGLLRQAFFEKGSFADAYLYSLLRWDYTHELHF